MRPLRHFGFLKRRFLAGVASIGGSTLMASRGGRFVATAAGRKIVCIVPNFHPASCGWLTTFSKERVCCADSYLDHLDRVRDDPHCRIHSRLW